jgi:vancomycin resistance protein VanW
MILPLRDIRREGSRLRRFIRDSLSGRRFARVAPEGLSWPVRASLTQPITHSDHAAAKRHNIALASGSISGVLLEPGGIFSYWSLVGRPSARRSFRPGRSLVGGRLVLDYGGGLCQLSGLLYHLALQSGLAIIERYPHSLDLYPEEERYTPLGSDAAVAFGFKDLRFSNPYRFPITLRIELAEWEITARCLAPEPIEEPTLLFDRSDPEGGGRLVRTWRVDSEGARTLLDTSHYLVHDGSPATSHVAR